MAFADYDFYKSIYIGKLSEADFTRLSERASDHIDGITGFLITSKGIENFPEEMSLRIKKAVCAVSEVLYGNENGGFKTSEKVGDYSVSYAAGGLTAEQKIDSAVMMYIPDLVKAARWI